MERIVVGIDGSAESHMALQWAVDEARLRGAQLGVVHAWQPIAIGAYPYGGTAAFDPADLEAGATALADEAMADVDVSGLGSPPTVTIPCASPASALVEAAKGAAMVVVGSRGRGGFTGLLLGSVSQQVVHHAPCPVVIVRGD